MKTEHATPVTVPDLVITSDPPQEQFAVYIYTDIDGGQSWGWMLKSRQSSEPFARMAARYAAHFGRPILKWALVRETIAVHSDVIGQYDLQQP